MKPMPILWWRYGKEHDPSGSTFQLNPPEVVAAHLDEKLARQRAEPPDAARCWQVDDDLLIERARVPDPIFGSDTRMYYLPKRGLAVVENLHFPQPEDARWSWYIHVARIYHDEARGCWIKQDLFADIVADRAARECLVVDLDDLAAALDLGLVTAVEAGQILRQTQAAVHAINRGAFPFPEIERGREACRGLGWS
jgi:hypothetical protein